MIGNYQWEQAAVVAEKDVRLEGNGDLQLDGQDLGFDPYGYVPKYVEYAGQLWSVRWDIARDDGFLAAYKPVDRLGETLWVLYDGRGPCAIPVWGREEPYK